MDKQNKTIKAGTVIAYKNRGLWAKTKPLKADKTVEGTMVKEKHKQTAMFYFVCRVSNVWQECRVLETNVF